MKHWTIGVFVVAVPACAAVASGAIQFYEDFTIQEGDEYWTVEVYNQAHLTMTGGTILNRLHLREQSMASISGGEVGFLSVEDSALANIYPDATFHSGGYLYTRGSGVLNLYGGQMPVNWLAADAHSIVNFYVDDFVYTPGGGAHGEGRVTGTWTTGDTFQVDLRNRYGGDADPTWTHIVMDTPSGSYPLIPEPSTIIIWSMLGALALTVGWRLGKPSH